MATPPPPPPPPKKKKSWRESRNEGEGKKAGGKRGGREREEDGRASFITPFTKLAKIPSASVISSHSARLTTDAVGPHYKNKRCDYHESHYRTLDHYTEGSVQVTIDLATQHKSLEYPQQIHSTCLVVGLHNLFLTFYAFLLLTFAPLPKSDRFALFCCHSSFRRCFGGFWCGSLCIAR